MTCVEHIESNLQKALSKIGEAAKQGAQIVCLQELFNALYPCQSESHARFDWAEPIPGPTTTKLQAAAKQHSVVLIAGLFEERAPGLYHNSSVIIDRDGSLAGIYRKMHIPDDPTYYEKFYFAPGDKGFMSVETQCGQVGPLICWDQWYPEAARLTALAGAQFLFYPTAIGWLDEDRAAYGESQCNAWQTMMRSHAIANGVYVIAANRVGREEAIQFWGNSFICDPYGNLIATASRTDEEILIADCDVSLIKTARTYWPFLRDRRIDAYGGLTQRFLK